MDSFVFLHSLTGGLKGNIFSPVLPADTEGLGSLIDEYEDSLASTLVEYSDSSYAIGSHRISCDGFGVILPVAGEGLMDALSNISQNPKKSEFVRGRFSEVVDDEAVLDAYNHTLSLFSDALGHFQAYEELYEVLSPFTVEIPETVRWKDVFAQQVVLSTISAVLEHRSFEDVECIDFALILSVLEEPLSRDADYIDKLALALGRGKTIAETIGLPWLYNALNGLLYYALEAIE